jgi:hypothetical protein
LGLEFEKSESELKKEAKKETKMVKPKKSITDKK